MTGLLESMGKRGSKVMQSQRVGNDLPEKASLTDISRRIEKIMFNKKTLSLLILGSPLLFGINDAAAFRSFGDNVASYCNSRGYDFTAAYASDSCSTCHSNKNEYSSGNYEYFCPPPPPVVAPVCTDADNDGYFKEGDTCGTQADFNDNNSAAYPGAIENCNDGVDNDGNGLTDSADPNAVGCAVMTVCTDIDGDGYSTDGGTCGPIDCDDNNYAVNPGANEVCSDGIDNNCNGSIDTADLNAVGCTTGCSDQDGDSFSPDGGSCGPIDCNDNDPEINPGALEICNDGNDNNCNNKTDGSDGVCQDSQLNEPHWWRGDSNVVNPAPTPNPTPTPPGPTAKSVDLQATADSYSVRLNWSLTGITARAQEVYRDTDANPNGRSRIGFMRNGNSFVDDNVTQGMTYYYWIKVTESDRTITNSQAAAVTVPNGSSPNPTPTPPNPTPTPPNPTSQHPFGWSNPRYQHQDADYSVSSCTSCHSIDSTNRSSQLSCYLCHGNKWDESGGSDDDDDRKHHDDDGDDRKHHDDD
jgi:hypothetical protein